MRVIDARRGEVFYAFYRQVPGGVQRITEPRSASPDDLASELLAAGEEVLLVGDGALRYRRGASTASAGSSSPTRGHAYPSAASLVQLAHAQALREECVQPVRSSTPLYLRKPDAEINWTTRDGAGT